MSWSFSDTTAPGGLDVTVSFRCTQPPPSIRPIERSRTLRTGREYRIRRASRKRSGRRMLRTIFFFSLLLAMVLGNLAWWRHAHLRAAVLKRRRVVRVLIGLWAGAMLAMISAI